MDRTGLEMRALNRLKRVATEKKPAKKKKAPVKKEADVKKNTEASRKDSKKLDKLLAKSSHNTFERMGRLLMKMKADGMP